MPGNGGISPDQNSFSVPVEIPADGGGLEFMVRLEGFAAGCGADVMTVRVAGETVATFCEALPAWTPTDVDLSAYAGQIVFAVFEATLASPGVAVPRLDDVKFTGKYLCDDGDACTEGDACLAGFCFGQSVPGCN